MVVGPRKVKHEDARRTVPLLNTSEGGKGGERCKTGKRRFSNGALSGQSLSWWSCGSSLS